MLSDQILKSFLNNYQSYPQCVHDLVHDISCAHKFALSNGVVETIVDISNYELSFFLKAIKFLLIPHPRLWIEFDFQHRSNLIQGATSTLGVRSEDVFMPSRIGYYIETNRDNTADVVIVWMYDSSIAFSSYGFSIDLSNKQLDPDYLENLYEKQYQQFENLNKSQAIEILALEHYFKNQVIHRYSKPAFELATKKQDWNMLNKLHSCGIHDTKGEWRFLMSVFIFLSSANSFKIVSHEETKKTKSYEEIQLLSKQNKDQQCFVRPHYKIRKTGIFAWRPHFRSVGKSSPVKIVN